MLLYPLIIVSDWQGEKAQRGVHFREGKPYTEPACYTAIHHTKTFTLVAAKRRH